MLNKLQAICNKYEELCARSEQPDFYADPQKAAKQLREKNDSKGQPIKETDLTTNRLQYALLGDPAMPLNIPTQKVVVDSINGIAVDGATELPVLKAGMIAKIDGHVVNGILKNAAGKDGVPEGIGVVRTTEITWRHDEASRAFLAAYVLLTCLAYLALQILYG